MITPIQADTATGLLYSLRKTEVQHYKGCLVLLHGVGSNETSMYGLADGIPEDVLVAFVRGPLALGPNNFAWFQVAFTPNGPKISPEQAEQSRSLLVQFLAELNKAYNIPPEKTVIAGFSQGGIMSASVALTTPQAIGGFGLLSGRILPEIEPLVAETRSFIDLKGFVSHGEADNTLPVDWAHKSHEWLNQLGIQHAFNLYPAPHTITQPMHNDFIQWLSLLV